MLYEASGRRVKNFLTYLPSPLLMLLFSSPPSLLHSVLSHDTHPPCKSCSEWIKSTERDLKSSCYRINEFSKKGKNSEKKKRSKRHHPRKRKRTKSRRKEWSPKQNKGRKEEWKVMKYLFSTRRKRLKDHLSKQRTEEGRETDRIV